MKLSYCVVNTNGGELLGRCLDAIERTRPADLESETIVLDNASDDGSADHARRDRVHLIELTLRQGKAESDSMLLRAAKGEFCLLLNEDSELLPGAVDALLLALDGDPTAGAAGAQLLDTNGDAQPCAWRFPGVGTALAASLMLHKRFTVQSGGTQTCTVDWAQSAALLVRRDAARAVEYFDDDFFVYGDEVDFCKRLGDTGWHVLYVPDARCFHREGLSHGASARARIVEFHRGRNRYMLKHHGAVAAAVVRCLVAFTYSMRALAALVMPGHDAQRYSWHARAALCPRSGSGLREAAAGFNNKQTTDH